MNNPKVSIIIPSFNSEEWIEETIKSVLRQSYENIECVIVDDGSQDDSVKKAKGFEDSRLIIVEQQNQGACSARNHGFRISTGDYICYLDADDAISENKIERQIELLIKSDKGSISSSRWSVYDDNILKAKDIVNENYRDFTDVTEWFINAWQYGAMAAIGTWMCPRNLIEEAGPWDENVEINQDGEFFFRVLMKSSGIVFCSEGTYYYRRGDYKSISKRESRANSLLKTYITYEDVLQKKDNTELRKALSYNYCNFIYQYSPKFQEEVKKAYKRLENLGSHKVYIGGMAFRFLTRLLGFPSAISIRNKFK